MDNSDELTNQQKMNAVPSNCRTDAETRRLTNTDIENSLKQEIMQLEKNFNEQISARDAMEKALGYRASSVDTFNEVTLLMPASKLVKDIAILELEVGHLEQYLLSLYKRAFDQQIPYFSPSKNDEEPKSKHLDVSRSSEIHRSHSSLEQCSALVEKTPPAEDSGKALRSCHSQPVSMSEYVQSNASNIISLGEHLGTRMTDNRPNKLSEDMIKCMSIIYYRLSDSPLMNHTLSSPISSISSMSSFSPKEQGSFDAPLDNPFHFDSTMIEIASIKRNGRKFDDSEYLIQNFRYLVSRLENFDPGKMTHEEKLSFWINVHNALVMHAFLAYGVPKNNLKRMFLLLKASYNVGGVIVSANAIRNSILGCRTSSPGQWLRLLLPSRTKSKTSDKRQGYSIDRAEPLVHFALSTGNHSDPAVRIYTPKNVFRELEAAKKEYIQASFGVRKDRKIVLPKIVESFAKDSGISYAGILEMVRHSLPESLRKSVKKQQLGKIKEHIKWAPYNFSFRYLILRELVQ